MNKRNKQIVPLCFLIAVVIFAAILYTMISTSYEEYKNTKDSKNVVEAQFKTAKDQYEQSKVQKEKDQIQLQSIKPVYETKEDSTTENLGVFGTMFEDIIKKAQSNGLLIRSIEYDMRPADDQIYLNYTESYNVCELKFFLVGTYSQLRNFLKEMTNDFPYLVSVSKLNITAFSGNTDYILISMSLNIYSKKPNAKKAR